MKIGITKSSGAYVELSDVAGIQIIEGPRLVMFRLDPMGHPYSSFRYEFNGTYAELRDLSIPWPHVEPPFA